MMFNDYLISFISHFPPSWKYNIYFVTLFFIGTQFTEALALNALIVTTPDAPKR